MGLRQCLAEVMEPQMGSRDTNPSRVIPLQIERSCVPDREAMLTALRVVLRLPKVPVALRDKGKRNSDRFQDDSATCERSTLAILPKKSDVCRDAQPVLDPECVERLCRVWAEVGRAILLRRRQRQ